MLRNKKRINTLLSYYLFNTLFLVEKMKYFYLTLLIITSYSLSAQTLYNELRYRERIFSGSTVTTDVQYGSAPQWVWPYWNENLKMDVYTPYGDLNTNRPLVILAHSGGFLNGSKDCSDMAALCDSLTRLGYVTATIEYRKGFNPLDAESAERAVYRGIQDGKAAVRYFKQNAASYGVDTNYIYFGGMSAGGYMALHVAYMDLESERPASSYGGGTVNDLGCLDCAGNTYAHSSKVRAILDYWGAVQDTSIINTGDIPLMIMHGENDPTVPFNYGHPFGLATLPQTYGGFPVSLRVQHVGLDYEFYTSTGPLHMLDGSNNGTFDASNPPNSFWYDTLLPRTKAFLYRMTKPNPTALSPDTVRICYGEPIVCQVSGGATSYYKWTYSNTNLTNVQDNHSANLSFNVADAGSFDVAVVEFNEVLCASDTIWFHVIQYPDVVADFNYNIANLNDVSFTNNSSLTGNQTWNFGDGATSTAENPQHIYTANGTYSVQLIVADGNGCNDTLVQQVVIQSLGLDELTSSELQVYPNPCEDVLHLANQSTGELQVTFVDLNGKIMLNGNVSVSGTLDVNVQNWNAGMYFVQVTDVTGANTMYKIIRK